MIKAFVFSALCLYSAVAGHPGAKRGPSPPRPVVNNCNNTCLTITLSDFYGDGWDGVAFHGEEEGGGVMAAAPDCLHNRVVNQICPDHDGTYYFTAVHSNSSYVPENYWEVFWTATSHNCDGSVAKTFTGGFNSSLIMDYTGNEWSIQYWENLWDNEKSCDACGDAKRCQPKKPKKKKSKSKPGSGKPISGTSNTTKVAKPKPRYGPPAVNLRVTMYDDEGNGWWKNDYSGQSWYLADDRREKLFHTGTLCDGSKGYCNVCLGDGSYTMRFTGDMANFTAWDFCGVVGQRSQELSFHVKKGKCIADSIVSLSTDCTGTVESHVTLTGVLAMSGFKSEFSDRSTFSVVSNAVASVFPSFGSSNVQVLSSSLDARVLSDVSNIVQDYTFEMKFIAEAAPFKVDGRSYAALQQLTSSIASTISSSILAGDFVEKLHSEASLQNVASLSSEAVAELISIEVSNVEYIGTNVMGMSNLPALSYDSTTLSYSISSYDLGEGIAFLAVAIVGFVAFVGVMAKGMKQYDSLPLNSEHSEVTASEMDASIGSLAKKQSVFRTDKSAMTANKL